MTNTKTPGKSMTNHEGKPAFDSRWLKPKLHKQNSRVVVPGVAVDDGIRPCHGLFRVLPEAFELLSRGGGGLEEVVVLRARRVLRSYLLFILNY